MDPDTAMSQAARVIAYERVTFTGPGAPCRCNGVGMARGRVAADAIAGALRGMNRHVRTRVMRERPLFAMTPDWADGRPLCGVGTPLCGTRLNAIDSCTARWTRRPRTAYQVVPRDAVCGAKTCTTCRCSACTTGDAMRRRRPCAAPVLPLFAPVGNGRLPATRVSDTTLAACGCEDITQAVVAQNMYGSQPLRRAADVRACFGPWAPCVRVRVYAAWSWWCTTMCCTDTRNPTGTVLRRVLRSASY